jgi:hypothetical protein
VVHDRFAHDGNSAVAPSCDRIDVRSKHARLVVFSTPYSDLLQAARGGIDDYLDDRAKKTTDAVIGAIGRIIYVVSIYSSIR